LPRQTEGIHDKDRNSWYSHRNSKLISSEYKSERFPHSRTSYLI